MCRAADSSVPAPTPLIVLFTDFGLTGPYTGQMKAVLARAAPGVPVIDLMADAPGFAPQPAAYLLAALAPALPPPCVFVCVVDPGVGGARRPIAMQADGRIFVGPDNGLLEPIRRRAAAATVREILWRPERLSASFHGRDLFAPVAARLARDGWDAVAVADFAPLSGSAPAPVGGDWPDDWAAVIYIDHYGNVMTGLRASCLPENATLALAGRRLPRVRTFGDVPAGAPLVYENSCGLLEIAVNGGAAAALPGLRIGDPVTVVFGDSASGGAV